METYISLLRGINVSGQKKIKMSDLLNLYNELGFINVKTYIQTGNVLFQTDEKDLSKISNMIQNKIKDIYEFEVPVIIRKNDEISTILKSNPFLEQENLDINNVYITFLNQNPLEENLTKMTYSRGKELNYEPDKFIINEKEIYIFCSNGYGQTKLTNNFFENKLKVIATTRNLKTLNNLLEIGKL